MVFAFAGVSCGVSYGMDQKPQKSSGFHAEFLLEHFLVRKDIITVSKKFKSLFYYFFSGLLDITVELLD